MWRFHCSLPKLVVDARGLTAAYMAASHEFRFASAAGPSLVVASEWLERLVSVEVHQISAGTIGEIAKMARWLIRPDDAGFIRLEEDGGPSVEPSVSFCFELDERRFVLLREFCAMMLTSPRSLVLSITCGVPGFASPGEAGAPTPEEFAAGAPLMVRRQDIQFGLSER